MSVLGGKTVGARALVLRDNEILLVRHTYNQGWYSIGGAVDSGETPLQALTRELKEEVGIHLTGKPILFGVYYNNCQHRDDYVVMYLVKDFSCEKESEEECEKEYEKDKEVNNDKKENDFEIAEKRWFSLDHLPSELSPGTQRRIHEYLSKTSPTEQW